MVIPSFSPLPPTTTPPLEATQGNNIHEGKIFSPSTAKAPAKAPLPCRDTLLRRAPPCLARKGRATESHRHSRSEGSQD